MRGLPTDAARFLVDYGNKLNEQATATTILQVWRSTSTVEPGFHRKKQAMGLKYSSIVLNEEKSNSQMPCSRGDGLRMSRTRDATGSIAKLRN